MDASEVLYSTPTVATNLLSTEMSLTPTTHQQQQQQQQPTPLSPLATTTIPAVATTPTTPRTTSHTPREIPTMYILDQMYDDYMDQYNGNNITTPTEVPETNASLELAPCPICSRTFNPQTLRKHVGICEKMATKKRNIFDSSRQRREGTDLATYPLPKNFGLPDKNTSSTSITQSKIERGQSPRPGAQQISSPILQRKKTSEDFTRSTARASMRKAVSTQNNTSLAATTSSTNFNRDRLRSSERSLTRRGIQPLPSEQCPHCERCFGIKAYDRHVEWCKEKALLAAIKQGGSKNDGNVAKARLEARTKYKAPCLKTKRSMNREKYSGLAGEDLEFEDTSKSFKANGSKTQDNSLMTMSMTLSMCSERKIMNSTTGNINEPVAKKAQTNSGIFSVGNRKCTCDKSQTPLPPTTIIKANAMAATEVKQKEPIINLEFHMPESHFVGEQMSATAINKKRHAKTAAATTTHTKVDTLKATKIKPPKQQRYLTDSKKVVERNAKKSKQNLKTTDVQLHLTSAVFEPWKSASDLSSKSLHCVKHLTASSHCNDHCRRTIINDYSYNPDEDELKLKANEAPVENFNSLNSFSYCGYAVNTNENEMNLRESKHIAKDEKITMKEHFETRRIFDLVKPISETKCLLFHSEENEEGTNNTAFSETVTENVEETFVCSTQNAENSDLFENLKSLDLIMKQTYPEQRDYNANDNDNENIEEENVPFNSILQSIPNLDIPKSPLKTSSKDKNISTCKNVKRSRSRNETRTTEANIGSKVNKLKNPSKSVAPPTAKTTNSNNVQYSLEYLDPKESYSETEIYKDCLTDSDELRRKTITTQAHLSNSVYNINDEDLHTHQLKTKSTEYNFKSSKGSLQSHTFIRDMKKISHEILKNTKISKSSEDLTVLKNKLRNSSVTKASPNTYTKYANGTNAQRNDTPRTNSLKLPRLSSPPQQRPHTTTNKTKSECSSRLQSLSMCQPKRKKVLRQTASCTNATPMKVTIPLSKESLEICGVVSAPQIKVCSVRGNFVDVGRQVKEIDYNEELCLDIWRKGGESKNIYVEDKEIKVIKEPPQLKRNKSFTVTGLPDNYDPFLSAKRQLEELCSPTSDSVEVPTTSQTSQLPSMPATPNGSSKMSTSLILSSSTPNTTPSLTTTAQIPQQTQKTPILARSSSFRRTSSLRGPRRSPLLSTRPPLFAQKHRPTIQRGLSDEGPISNNFLKPEEYDEMPVRSVCVNDFAVNKSPRVVRRDTSASSRKQALKLNINAGNANTSSATQSPSIGEKVVENNNATSKYVSKTDSLAVFLKYEHELEKLNKSAVDTSQKNENTKTPSTPLSNLDGPLNAKELKDKSNNLSKQNSAKNIKADILATSDSHETALNSTTEIEPCKYGQVRLTALATSTPLTKSSTPLPQQVPPLTPLNIKKSLTQNHDIKSPKSPKPVALSSLLGNSSNKTSKQSTLLYTERKNSVGPDYIDPKLINKCDNLPINLNFKQHTDFKHSDSDTSEPRMEHLSSSSSESSALAKKTTSLAQHAKFLPEVKQQPRMQQEQNSNKNNTNQKKPFQHISLAANNSQRNSVESRNLLKRRMRLGRNQFLYDASPEGDSCSADDEGANRSSMEGDTIRHQHLLKNNEKASERLNSPFMPPLSSLDGFDFEALDDFDFEEFLSLFGNDEEQFTLFRDCREFLMNRSSKKQRSMLMANSLAQNNTNTTGSNKNSNSTNLKNLPSPQTFPPLTPQQHSATAQHFQFPSLPQHPKNVFNSFTLNARSQNNYEELKATISTDTFSVNSSMEDCKDNPKREIFISIETEQNDLDKSPISPNSIRNMVGNPQTVVEVEVDAAHDNKFSKISDDDTDPSQNICRSKNFSGNMLLERLPNVQLNNAKNCRQMGDEISGNSRLAMDHRTALVDINMNSNSAVPSTGRHNAKMNRAAGTPSGDAYGDSDELSSLDGYPLSSPNSRLGVSSKTSADSAYGSLSRQRSSELASQRSSSRNRPMTSATANTLLNRPLTEETSLGRSRQLSASSSSSSEQALPPITSSNSYHKMQQLQQQQLYNNNNNIANDFDDLMRYDRSSNNNNNNYDIQPTHPSMTEISNSHSNLESLQQYNSSNSNMSTSMKLSRFCHECGSKFLLEQAKFCMDCGVKRIAL